MEGDAIDGRAEETGGREMKAPNGWSIEPLSWAVESLESGISEVGDERDASPLEPAVLKVSAVTSGRFIPDECKTLANESKRQRTSVKGDSILVNRANGSAALVGISVYVPRSYPNRFLPDKIWQITANKSRSTGRYLALVTSMPRFRDDVLNRSSGGTGMRNIGSGRYLEIEVFFPPLPEQRKIAEILGTWDEALEKLDAIIAAKARRQQSLMQQLLTGKRRLKGFDHSEGKKCHDSFGDYPADWKHRALGEITVESGARNGTGGSLPVLSSTKHRGLVLSEEYFGRRIYAEDTSNYRVVRRGEFAYATNHIEEGSIGYQNLYDVALVSPIYTVFKTIGEVEDRYLFRVLKSPLLIHLYKVNTSASVDRRGSLRYGQFSKIQIWLPGKKEQTAIANVLDVCDEELNLLRFQRAALDRQKRGLMQRLLTGRVRVKI